MPKANALASRVYLKLNGSEVQRPVMQNLKSLIVDQHTHLPGYFAITFYDSDLKLLGDGPFDLTKEVEILAAKENGDKVSIFKGEITSLEPNFDEGMNPELTVSGYDKSHRLFRETKSRAFINIKDSDLATKLAGEAGLTAEVETTDIVYDHIYQHNQSNLAFLMSRAWRIGYECFVSEGKLYFRKPPAGSNNLTATWGKDLTSFRPRMTLAEQVDEVMVKGWDVDKQKPIVGQATNGGLYPKIGESKNGKQWAGSFGKGKMVIVDQPVVSQSEANQLAKARMDEISGAFIEAEGGAFRRPDLRAGQMIKIEKVGKRFSGTYLITNATHVYSGDGFRTTFTVRGSRTGLLSEQINHQPPLVRWPGVVIGIVSNTDDPMKWGRVKIKFPWMADDAESDWARVMGIGAGNEDGFCVIPEVGDEVLVIFNHGDFSQPFVLGGLWNGQNKMPKETANAPSGEMPKVRTWHSAKGHIIAVYDNADDKIEIKTAKGHIVVLDDQNAKISITSKGGHKVILDDNSRKITIESTGDVEMKASMNMKIEAGGNMDIKANGTVTVKGAMINLN